MHVFSFSFDLQDQLNIPLGLSMPAEHIRSVLRVEEFHAPGVCLVRDKP